MKELKEKLIKNLEGYNFDELEIFLGLQKDPDVRQTIMSAMQRYYPEQFESFVERY